MIPVLLVAALHLGAAAGRPSGAPATPRAGGEALERPGVARVTGALGGDPGQGFRFTPDPAPGQPAGPVALGPGMTISFEGKSPSAVAGLPPFRLDLGLGQRLSGRLIAVTKTDVRLGEMAGEGALTVARDGVLSVVQRPGESQVFHDGFETLDTARWVVVGEPEIVADPHAAESHALKVPAGGTSLTHRLDEPFGSGRLELAFHDTGAQASGQQWFVDLTFRGPAGRETIRTVLGWVEESLAVESSPVGPALAVQRLARVPGWHRLSLRFGPERTEVAIDGNELAHGKGPGGPLAEVRLASYAAPKARDPGTLAGFLDDLRLVRFGEPFGLMETDVTQDELRLTTGDQVFGALQSADADTLGLRVDGRETRFRWGEVAGVYLRRKASQGKPVDGLLVRVRWRAAAGNDPRDLNEIEGALVGVTARHLAVATPYAGTVNVPRDLATTMTVLGKARRVVVDPTAHHLGDEISAVAPILDPPQPEGGVLECVAVLDEVPDGTAWLVLDVVQVVGEAAELPFSGLLKKGELRTNVKINGEPFDYLNRHISTRNEAPERIRLPIPAGLLRPGKNVIRFEQAGIASDPNYLDDLGLLGVALEFGGRTGR